MFIHCHECSELALYLRPFIFNGIPMLFIRLTWDFSRPYRRVGMGWEGKTTSKRLHVFRFQFHRMEASNAKCMYFKFHDRTFIGEFSTANFSFGCIGLMYLV